MARLVDDVTSVQSHSKNFSYATILLAVVGFIFITGKLLSLVRLFSSLFIIPGLPVRLSHDFSHSRIFSMP